MTPPPADVIVATLARSRGRRLADLVALAKPRVVVMVLVTTVVGYYLGLDGSPGYAPLLALVLGTVLAAGGTLALNQYWERDLDARMERTRTRPLPDGRLRPAAALLFGSAGTGAGIVVLAAGVNPRAAAVTGAIVTLYLFVYTPLKLRTPLCTLVGAVPGALPPVTGWVAARGEFGAGAWVLFGILFLWQLPHTLAIGRLYRDDYARAGVRLLPVVDGAGAATERQILTGCVGLLTMSVLPAVAGLAGVAYLVGAVLLGLAFVALGARHALAPSAATARRVLYASLLYLPLLLGLLVFDKV